MILESNHTKEAITAVRNVHFKGKDPQLVEKILKALTLLELLAEEKIDFVFKGGTCLMVLLGKPRRFSIDLDIIVEKKDAIVAALVNICKKSQMFTRFEEDKRKETKVPKGHYKVFYNPGLGGKEAYVLVDIIVDASPYPKTKDSEIKPTYFLTKEPYLKVKTPTVNGILGDKMTAFAPQTTGIKLKVEKEMEIAKQLFDVATLFDHLDDLSEVRSSFLATADKEIQYRELGIPPENVLHDTFGAAQIIALQGAMEKEIFDELQSGTKKLAGYTFESFGLVQIHICAAKSAYLTRLIHKNTSPPLVYKGEDMKDVQITHQDFTKLNKIKKTSPEAFFYWKAAVDLEMA